MKITLNLQCTNVEYATLNIEFITQVLARYKNIL